MRYKCNSARVVTGAVLSEVCPFSMQSSCQGRNHHEKESEPHGAAGRLPRAHPAAFGADAAGPLDGRPSHAGHPRLLGHHLDDRGCRLSGLIGHHHVAHGLPARHGTQHGQPVEDARHVWRSQDGAGWLLKHSVGPRRRSSADCGGDDEDRPRQAHRARRPLEDRR